MLRQLVKYSSRIYNISRSRASRTLSQLNTKKRVLRINSNTSARKFWGASTANYSTQNNNANTNKILEEDIPDAEWDVPPEDKMSFTDVVHLMKDNGVIEHDDIFQTCLKIEPDLFIPEQHENSDMNDPTVKRALITPEETAQSYVIYMRTLEELRPGLRKGMKVLDIGSGTGFMTACLASMVGETGVVVGIDTDITQLAHANKVIGQHYPELKKIIKFRQGNGLNGFDAHKPYNAIHIGGAVDALPATLFEQLAPGGLMTVPIIKDGTQYLCWIEKVEGNKAKQTLMMEVDFERLVKSEDDKANDLPAEDASDPNQPKPAH